MPVYISLLRGINVGGNTTIKMDELRDLYASQGLSNVQTVLQSGNVVFQSPLTDSLALSHSLEAGISQRFGLHTRVFLRTLDEFKAMLGRNPFSADESDPARMVVMFLSDIPTGEAVESLKKAYDGPETMYFRGTEVFLYYPDGQGRSRLTNVFIERKLNVSGTARNWNTVNRLLALAERFEDA